MMATMYRTATQYVANAITLRRGTYGDITLVGVYHDTDPSVIPNVSDFTEVLLVNEEDELGETGFTDVLSLIGPRGGVETLAPGDYQRYVLVSTATEDIIERVDVLTIL